MENSDKNIKGLNIKTSNTGILIFQIDNPKKKNSLNANHLKIIKDSMQKAINNVNIKCILFCNKNDSEYFTSGNDFNNFGILTYDEMASLFEDFINFLIKYPKILVAAVNGICVGMGVTMLCHFDIVLASERARFWVPFIQTLQVPEGTSSYMFPKLMGKLAGHMLYAGQGIDVNEAKSGGLVTAIIDSDSEDNKNDVFFENTLDYVNNICKNSTNILMKFKSMIKKHEIDFLIKINKEEVKMLRESWDDQNFKNIMKKFVKPKF